MYLDNLKLCVVCINGRWYVCCGECYVVSYECDEPTSCLVQPIVAHCCEVMYFGGFDFRGELGFLNCDDICMCVLNKQFELPEFVFESVYVDLQYDAISLHQTDSTCEWVVRHSRGGGGRTVQIVSTYPGHPFLGGSQPCDNNNNMTFLSKRHRLHAVEVSQRSGKPCANFVDPTRPQQ